MTREDWECQLDQNPKDWILRLVYADWLWDQELESAALCQRWMAKHKKCSTTSTASFNLAQHLTENGREVPKLVYDWWAEGEEADHRILAYIPRCLILVMPPAPFKGTEHSFREFLTRQEAEAALELALIITGEIESNLILEPAK